MRSLRLAVLALLVAPGSAFAADATVVTREVPLHGAARTLAAARSPEFNMVGLHWQGSGRVFFRAHGTNGRWSKWRPAAPEAEDRPDPGSPELAHQGWRLGNPYWTGPSDQLEVRTRGKVRRVRAHYVWSPVEDVPVRSVTAAGSPLILSRLAWGANERIRRGLPQYADALRFAIVHHTAGSNTYTRAQSAAIVRGIQLYHVRSNGWNDIGYNFLVDKYGQVFEGRFGGMERNVVGAHAQGFNTGSTGVALLGNYDSGAVTPAARTALTRLLAWRLDISHIDPLTIFGWVSGGNPRFPAGVPVTLRSIAGHRDTGFTSCPGARLYGELNGLARAVSQTGLPKLYEPVVSGAPGGLVRFTATLTEPLPWSVLVTDRGGAVVASGQGEGSIVDWTWDARSIPAGRYAYAIEAGPTVHPATGFVSGTASQSTLTAIARPALITPNGDGRGESTTIRYRLAAPALVTVTVVDSAGAPVATLFSEQRPAGNQEFRWNAAGIPDGRYGLVISARNDLGIETTATVAVIVDRTLAGFRVVPQVFSPNHDGRLDTTKFRFVLNGPARVTLEVRRSGRTIGQVFAGRLLPGRQAIEWNGFFRRRVGESEYFALLRSTSTVATVAQRVEFAVDTTPPRLRVLSGPQLRFSINEPGFVTVVLDDSRTLVHRRLIPGRFTIPGGGSFTRFRATARDFVGNETRPLGYP
jgi:N-acetylmuramoyl-L-alanine amidase/FlgD Ig-like domain